MIAATELRLVLVTPEKTLLDQPVRALQFPLYDGQIGVLPGRAPLVGRLGTGELKFAGASGDQRYFIQGGFAQIKGGVVSILTDRAIPAEKITAADAQAALDAALALTPHDDAGFVQKQKAVDAARQQLAIVRR